MNQPIIGVSINYRLSGFGFIYSDAVSSAGLANLGLLDQRLALHWIQENIAAFGGSPDKVTIWGESAGAVSVGAHILAYGGRDDGLFRAAIAQSGGPIFLGLNNARTARENSDNITRITGCADVPDELTCLRALPFDTLNRAMNVTPSYTFSPVIDGTFLTTLPSTQLASGAFVKVPLIIGANADEGTAFAPSGVNNDANFIALVRSYGANRQTAEIMSYLYPNIPAIGIPETFVDPITNTTIGTQYKRAAAFGGDFIQFGPRRATCEAWSNHSVSAYCYRFNVVSAGLPPLIGATHFQEVAFVMDNVKGNGYAINPFLDMPAAYTQLATLMSRSWISFVVNLQPNAHGVRAVPEWPMYNVSDGKGAQDMLFDANVSSLAVPERDTYRAEAISFVNELAATQFER